MKKNIITILLIMIFCGLAYGQEFGSFESFESPSSTKEISFSPTVSHLEVKPGQKFVVALNISIDEDWVFYSPDPGEAVLPGEIKVAGDNLKFIRTLWLADKTKTYKFGDITQTNNVYIDKTVVFVELQVIREAPKKGTLNFDLVLGGQICDAGESGLCKNIKGVEEKISLKLSSESKKNPGFKKYTEPLEKAVVPEKLKSIREGEKAPVVQEDFAGKSTAWSFWTALGFSILAGLSLNIMPCVLPVIPIRILSIVESAAHSRKRFVVLGLWFAFGIFLFFAAIAILNLILRLTVEQTFNISQHFQYPSVRIILALIVVALAANLFGIFNIILPSKVAAIGAGKKSSGILATISMGIMMAVLSTPCSAAFVAGAFAWAQVNPPLAGTVIIAAMGFGMAVPHALLCAYPQLVDKLPKPGKWMEMFRHAMGFILLPVALWLIGTLGADTYPVWVSSFTVVFVFGLWMWSTWVRFDSSLKKKVIVRGSAVALVVVAGFALLPKRADDSQFYKFVDYDSVAIEKAKEDGKIVLLKYTATWCTKCKMLEYTVFRKPEIVELFKNKEVYAVKADVTDKNMPATKSLNEKYGGAPPVTAIFKPDQKPVVFIGGFDKKELIKAIE